MPLIHFQEVLHPGQDHPEHILEARGLLDGMAIAVHHAHKSTHSFT